MLPTLQPIVFPSMQPVLQPSCKPSLLPTGQPSSQPSYQPTRNPSINPTDLPSVQPISQPGIEPSVSPTCIPSSQPSPQPNRCPSINPTDLPSIIPTLQPRRPTSLPSIAPTVQPFALPTSQPKMLPTTYPSSKPTYQPSGFPSVQPSRSPTSQPSTVPSLTPSLGVPTVTPTKQPSSLPSISPSMQPSFQPIIYPTSQPTSHPSEMPSVQPTTAPVLKPTIQPTMWPSRHPTGQPLRQPTSQPNMQPSLQPTSLPSFQPSLKPTKHPSIQPSATPSQQPSIDPSKQQPSIVPSAGPSATPSQQPTINPSEQPHRYPTQQPWEQPSQQPSSQPSNIPSTQPSKQPTKVPTTYPSKQPNGKPSTQPTHFPTQQPSIQPVQQPSKQPVSRPSKQPTKQPLLHPSKQPSKQPLRFPSKQPTLQPLRARPSHQPSKTPSCQPSKQPISNPTMQPSLQPQRYPSDQPSRVPSKYPSVQPLRHPSMQPSLIPSCQPTIVPTMLPTLQPGERPTAYPTMLPTVQPTTTPTSEPSGQPSCYPTCQPSTNPSNQPYGHPTLFPTNYPSMQPSVQPTLQPSSRPFPVPSAQPTFIPTLFPSRQPVSSPSVLPTYQPSLFPTKDPSIEPSTQPTTYPLGIPTSQPQCQPTYDPTMQPSFQPARRPTDQPSRGPIRQPSRQPIHFPTLQPSCPPSRQPSINPTSQPSSIPSCLPTVQPSLEPSLIPSTFPSSVPTLQPLALPSNQPSCRPISRPSILPTEQPVIKPTKIFPSAIPSLSPSRRPSHQPTHLPSRIPTIQPTVRPISRPSSQPSQGPTEQPTLYPSSRPSTQPSLRPSVQPTSKPAGIPTVIPSLVPYLFPSSYPTVEPSTVPRRSPSCQPSERPTKDPTSSPTYQPSVQPSFLPSNLPSLYPSVEPSIQPTYLPIVSPSRYPSQIPSQCPSVQPSQQPSAQPIDCPSLQPLCHPSTKPTAIPFWKPVSAPSIVPTSSPSSRPKRFPSSFPSNLPIPVPSVVPSSSPIIAPSTLPTAKPFLIPSRQPTTSPSSCPRTLPSYVPSATPTVLPVVMPTSLPTSLPLIHPSSSPTLVPKTSPSHKPNIIPSKQPSRQPKKSPSLQPNKKPSMQPSKQPLKHPSLQPKLTPSTQPLMKPSKSPSRQPIANLPTKQPSTQPLRVPSTFPSRQPFCNPSTTPSIEPSSSEPSLEPSLLPSCEPSSIPSCQPSNTPTLLPYQNPSIFPSTEPTGLPTIEPNSVPSIKPSLDPTIEPSVLPSTLPGSFPSGEPSSFPSLIPSAKPLLNSPTSQPTTRPIPTPTNMPIQFPVYCPSVYPSVQSPSTYSMRTFKPSSISISPLGPSPAPAYSTLSPTNLSMHSLIPSTSICIPITSAPTLTPTTSTQTQTQMPITSIPTLGPTPLPSQSPSSTVTSSELLTQLLITAQSLYSTAVSNCSQNVYCSYYEEVFYDTSIKIGGSAALSVYLESELKNLQLQSSVNSISYFRQVSFTPTDRYSSTRCSDANIARQIVSHMTNYNDYENDNTPSVYICAGDNWILNSCGINKVLKLCINCFDPCTVVSVNPLVVFPFMCTSSGCVSILQVGFRDENPPARIISVQPYHISEQQVSLNISLSDFSYVYCMAILQSLHSNPSVQVLLSQPSQFAIDKVATYSFYNLIPSTSYSVYCITQSPISRVLPSSNIFHTVVRTSCCKTVLVSVSSSYITSQVFYYGILQLKLSAAPSFSLTVQAVLQGQPATKSCNFTTLIISNTSYSRANHQYLMSLQCSQPLAAGSYVASITLGGYSATEFILNSKDTFSLSVIGENVSVSVPPSFTAAMLDNSGIFLTLLFSTATNKALLPDNFFCRDLLLFSFADQSKCQWLDSTTIKITFLGGRSPSVGSFIQLSKSKHIKKLTAACPLNYDCSRWQPISEDSRIRIHGPLYPVEPTVVANGPAEIDFCSPLLIDLSSSSGSAGKPWLNFTVTVTATNSNADGILSRLLALIQQVASDSASNNSYVAVRLPAGLLDATATYSFYFVACNWMQRCSGATYFVAQYNRSTAVPTTSIAGPAVRYIGVYNDLILNAVVTASPCARSKNTQISWEIFLGGVKLDISSHSNESNRFYLPGYSLQTDSQYLVRLLVTVPLTSNVFTSTMQVVVNSRLSADLVPIIKQGSSLTLSAGQSVVLHGNLSFDRTISPKIQLQDSSLVFSWSCSPKASNVSKSCDFVSILPGTAGTQYSTVLVTAARAVIGSSFTITMTISKGAVSNQASITLYIVDSVDNSCIVEIDPLRYGGSNIFIGQKLKLVAGGAASSSKNLSWSVTNLDIKAVSAGATNRLFFVSQASSTFQPFTFDLTILANRFSPGISYTFTLLCAPLNDLTAVIPHASIEILPNQPPIPGIFIISPQSGVELIELFGLYALDWYSEHLPLHYQLGFISPGTGFRLVAQRKSEVSYTLKAFPSGNPSDSYLLRCTLDVFDSLGSNYSTFNDTKVIPSAKNVATLSTAIFALNNSLVDTRETLYKLGIYSTSFNRANCSTSLNCSHLNRQPCLNTDYTCGPCLSSFIGQSGDSNTECIQSNTPNRKLLTVSNTSSCRNNKDCDVFQVCLKGACVNRQRDCPNMCSRHGNCSFVLTKTGLPTKRCAYYDTSCATVCTCTDGYKGVACSQTTSQHATSMRIRCSMVRALLTSMKRSNVDEESLYNWINLVNSLSFNVGEIEVCKATVFAILIYIVSYSAVVHMPFESMQLLSQTFDRLLTIPDMYLDTMTLIEKWSTTISSDIVPSQSVQSIEQHFRIRTVSSFTIRELMISEPVTVNERPTNYAVLNSSSPIMDGWATYTMIESQAALINSFEVNSNLITLFPNSFSSTAQFKSLKPIVILENNNAISDSKVFQSYNFTTFCKADEVANHTYSCPVGPNTITAHCSGRESIIHSYCPSYRYSTYCENFVQTNGSVLSCQKVNPQSVDTTTCVCSLQNDTSQISFHLTLAAGLRTELLYIPPTVSNTKAPQIEAYNVISAALIAVILVLFSVLGVWIRNKKTVSKFITKAPPTDNAHANKRGRNKPMWNDMELLVGYGERSSSLKDVITSAIPPVYLCSSILERIVKDFKTKSKYASLIYGEGHFRSCIAIITSWNITILILSVLIAALSDTERCKSMDSSFSCRRAVSRIDGTSSACRWSSASHSCTAISFSESGHDLFFILCLLLLWSMLLATPVIVLLQHFLVDKSSFIFMHSSVAPEESNSMVIMSGVSEVVQHTNNHLSANPSRSVENFVKHSQQSMSTLEADKFIRNLNRFFTKYHEYKNYLRADREDSYRKQYDLISRTGFAKPKKFSSADCADALQSIAEKVSNELLKVEMKGPQEKGVHLFSLLIEDLLPSLSARVFSNKRSRDELAIAPLQVGWVSGTILALVNIACFVTFSILASVESYDEQHVLLYSVLLWIFVDCFLVDVFHVLTADVMIPSIATSDLSVAIDTIQTAAVEPCMSSINARISNRNRAVPPRTPSATNFAPLFMPSVRLALLLPDLREARIISHFDTELSTFKGVFQCAGLRDTGASSMWTRYKRFWEYPLIFFFALETYIQEISIRIVGVGLSVAYIALYNALFNIAAAFILIPIALTLFVVYLAGSAPCEAVKIDIRTDEMVNNDLCDDSNINIRSGLPWMEEFSSVLNIMGTVSAIEKRDIVGVVTSSGANAKPPLSVLRRSSQVLHNRILSRRLRAPLEVATSSLDEIKGASSSEDSGSSAGGDDDDGDEEEVEQGDMEEKSDQLSAVQIVLSDSNSTIGLSSPLPDKTFSSSMLAMSTLSLTSASIVPLLTQDHSASTLLPMGRKISTVGALSPRPQLKKTIIVRSKPDLIREALTQEKTEDDRSVEVEVSHMMAFPVGSGLESGSKLGHGSNSLDDVPVTASRIDDSDVNAIREESALPDTIAAAPPLEISDPEVVASSHHHHHHHHQLPSQPINDSDVVHRPVSSIAEDNFNPLSVQQQQQKTSSPSWTRPSVAGVWKDSRKDIRRASKALFDTSPMMLVPRMGSPTQRNWPLQGERTLLSAPSAGFASDVQLFLPAMPTQLRGMSTAATRKVKREDDTGAAVAIGNDNNNNNNNSSNSHQLMSMGDDDDGEDANVDKSEVDQLIVLDLDLEEETVS
eukprot:gene27814-36642_t